MPTATRGDSRSFLLSLVVVSAAVSVLLFLYQVLDPMLIDVWDVRSGWYLEKYRTWGAKVWKPHQSAHHQT